MPLFAYTSQVYHAWVECLAFTLCTGQRSRSRSRTGALVTAEVKSILLVCDDLHEVDDVRVVELAEDFDLSDGCDGKSLLLILQSYLLQCHKVTCTPHRAHVSYMASQTN